ncbi:LacI family DNA-binding transcriptional regulator [Cerasicoccus arenae]|uniref:LacI family transcriptional regulator n=1 Tax=Cerasicoccus arenae TaxID=424488 RepID=A0A8J3GDL3_9BACT|nr:LacI family DNA-binding transcriptional regulator [Cerasicoccus arenae]MBK1857114.1 LacI family DNA-binding transcriptional regulator [Cerasicoccus arenae]GHB92447.1 LacI family transcriptional regulator [Cerasicoccus arenae]
MAQVSQRDIAKALQISPMTVSLALRNSPRLSDATRLRVQEAAESMGYQADPGLSALNNWRRNRVIRERNTTIAFLTNWNTANRWRKSYVNDFFGGAKESAAKRGYHLEPLWLGEYPTSKRATEVLRARGIRGLLIAPLQNEVGSIELDWNHFATVAVGPSLSSPRVHRAIHDYASGMRDVMKNLMQLGYRKIALGLPARIDEITEHTISDTFLATIQRYPELSESQLAGQGEESSSAANAWLRKHRPEVIITMGSMFPIALNTYGWKIPEEIAHVALRLPIRGNGRTAGITYASHEIGAVAIAKLDSLLQVNELGLPEHPVNLTVRGQWRDGDSVR